ncbi:MAG: RNA polymerase sigma factor RpoD/SigA [Candidatus Sumerlaeota bacterium]|nr:RNA polymerase sigma factor RpoD/SigA [Candidatus Sumerlaeota bacterium]
MIVIEDSLDIYLREISRYPVLNQSDEKMLFKRLRMGDETARNEIIRCNLRFVVKMALRYQNQGMPLPDLIQEGNMGLMEVVDKFDYRKGFRFSTYAAFWIKQSIQQALCKQSRLIRIPIRKSRAIGKLQEASKMFAKREGREPNAEELSGLTEVPADRVEQLSRMNEPALSLDYSQDENSPSLEDVLAQETTPNPCEAAMTDQMKSRVHKVMNCLNERERRILSLRFGFIGRRGLSLRSTSKFIGLSQEGVRRVEKKAIEKLRRAPLQKQIAGFL